MIGYYAHHQGAGHITRMQAIAAELATPVWGLSSAPEPAGWESGWTALARDDGPSSNDPGRDRDPTAHGVLHWAPLHHEGLARRSEQIARWVVDRRPQALVVDVSVEVTLLGRLCGVPTVVVAMPGQRDDRTHRLAYDAADALLAPWPRGSHGRDWPSHWVDKAWFVGGFSRFDSLTPRAEPAPAERAPAGRRTVLLLWGAGGRSTREDQVRSAQEATPQWRWVERSPSTTPSSRPLGRAAARRRGGQSRRSERSGRNRSRPSAGGGRGAGPSLRRTARDRPRARALGDRGGMCSLAGPAGPGRQHLSSRWHAVGTGGHGGPLVTAPGRPPTTWPR